VHVHPAIKNIIFDLGGVILNLDVDSTYRQFSIISGRPVDQLKSEARKWPFFNDYEKGTIKDEQFRDEVRNFLTTCSSDEEVDRAWNAMLLDLPLARIELLKKVGSQFRIFLLSNTNNIHLQCFTEIIRTTTNVSSLDLFFEKAYYSHLLNMRKPDEEIYHHVLQENQLKANETLFLDDNLANLQGATSVGIQTFHVKHPDLIFSLFDEAQP
jgi:glucose-1-phosphatase